MKYIPVLILTLLCISISHGQTQESYNAHVFSLCDSSLQGRGYVHQGSELAAKYIADKFKANGLKALSPGYFQEFSMPVNYFPQDIRCEVDGKVFHEGVDFIPVGYCPSVSFSGKVCFLPGLSTAQDQRKFLKLKLRNKALVMTSEQFAQSLEWPDKVVRKTKEAQVLIELTPSTPIFSPATHQKEQSKLQFIETTFPRSLEGKKMELNLPVAFDQAYPLKNVIGMVEGKVQPDTFLLVTGHYDHIGQIGEAYFPGANDNASGTAFVLSLMEHYSQPEHQPDYSMVFIAFAAEEAGLRGSYYYTLHPLVPLEQTKFLLNLDLVGAGSEGGTVVNATIHPREFALMDSVNTANSYVPKLKKRGKAANSDHFFFTEAGVPAFFYYSMGKVGGYHNVYDTVEALEQDQFENQFLLFREFLDGL